MITNIKMQADQETGNKSLNIKINVMGSAENTMDGEYGQWGSFKGKWKKQDTSIQKQKTNTLEILGYKMWKRQERQNE